MRPFPVILIVAFLSMAPGAQASDPLKSPECGHSIAALAAARGAADSAGEVESLRRAATLACLGGTGESLRPAPRARPPVVVAPPVIEVPPAPRAAVAAPPPPPLEIERPPVVTSCDAGGCWTSDGTRLNRSGPMLIGPGGACIASGNVVRCP